MNTRIFQKLSRFWVGAATGVLLVCVLVLSVSADSYPPTASLDEIKQAVSKVPKTHPRLFINQTGLDAILKKQNNFSLYKSLGEMVVQHADYYLDKAPIDRVQTGRRLLGKSRECLRRTLLLSMAYHLTSDMKYVERCEKEMLTVAGFSDWNPSHFLDVAEMTLALAIGYDWLYNQLDDPSRKTIRAAIKDKGVILPWTTKHKGWVRSTNNWGQVCHGGLTAGALAILEHEPELAAKTVHNALHNVTRSMDVYAPKGNYPEGPSYWSYGTSYNVILIEAIESVLGSDFGLSNAPGFVETGQYLSVVTGPSGLTFNYADGGSGRGDESAVFWFASKFNRPDWAKSEYTLLTKFIDSSLNSSKPRLGDRVMPFTLLWMDTPQASVENNMPLHWSGEGHVPITIHRSSWTDPNATFIGFKGGSPSANHGNMDIGSFVLDSQGVRWAVDLGAESYHGIEARGMNLWDRKQDSDRWTIFRQQNMGHNTLVIDGQLQVAKNFGAFERFSDDPKFPFSVLDMSEVYEGQVKTAKRGAALLKSKYALIRDELTGLKPGADVRWGMITPAKVVKNTGDVIVLEIDGKRMNLIQDTSAKWETIDVSKPQNEWDSPNRGMKMVTLNVKAPENGKLNISVMFGPGAFQKPDVESMWMAPFSKWE